MDFFINTIINYWLLVIIIILVLPLLINSIKIIQQSEVMIIERLGKYNRKLTSGINMIIPIIDKPRIFGSSVKIDLREAVYDFPEQSVITKDNVNVTIDALLYYQIFDPVRAMYEIVNLSLAIEKLTQTSLRSLIGGLELDETLSSRDVINSRLQKILDAATDKWGIKVSRVELQDIIPPDSIKEAMEKQMRAERDKRASILESEGQKRSQILESEGFRESEIKRAEGKKQSEVLKAEGESQARITIAEAEAKAIQIIAKVISSNEKNTTNYLIATKYINTLEKMVSGKDNKTVYIPFEATGVLGSLGGIKELLKQK